jgi:hypothetical protein
MWVVRRTETGHQGRRSKKFGKSLLTMCQEYGTPEKENGLNWSPLGITVNSRGD